MTWWYRWLCRLSGVLGAVCEYPAWARGGPAAPCARAPPRRARGLGSVGPAREAAAAAPGRLLWLPSGGRGSWVSGPGWRLWGRSRREPELPRGVLGAAGSRLCPSAAPASRGWWRPLQGPALPGPEAAAPVDLAGLGRQPPSPLFVRGAGAPQGQALRTDSPARPGTGLGEAAARVLCCPLCLGRVPPPLLPAAVPVARPASGLGDVGAAVARPSPGRYVGRHSTAE